MAKKKSSGEVSASVAKEYGVSLPTPPANDRFLSPNDIGKILNLTGEAVKQWIYQRRLPAVKLANGYWKVKASDLEAFLSKRQNFIRRVLYVGNAALGKIIVELGHEAIESVNAADALLKAINSVPALVVIDMSHKEVDAFKFAEKMAEIKQLKKAPVIFLGANLDAGQMDRAINLGIKAFVDPKDIQRIKDEIARNL